MWNLKTNFVVVCRTSLPSTKKGLFNKVISKKKKKNQNKVISKVSYLILL